MQTDSVLLPKASDELGWRSRRWRRWLVRHLLAVLDWLGWHRRLGTSLLLLLLLRLLRLVPFGRLPAWPARRPARCAVEQHCQRRHQHQRHPRLAPPPTAQHRLLTVV